MSIRTYARAVGSKATDPMELENFKVLILKFLDSQIFSSNLVALPAIIGSSDPRCSVSNVAEGLLRRSDSSIDWNNAGIISSMYVLFLGTLMPLDTRTLRFYKNPADTKIRLRLMPCFIKSKESTNFAPMAVKVFHECMWGASSNSKLKKQGIQFLQHVSFNAKTEKIKPVGGTLFTEVVKVLCVYNSS